MSRDLFLAERRIAVLCTEGPDGLPYLTAVWFAHEDGAFLIPTASTSRKSRNARDRPRGAIIVDSRGPAFRGVAASGRFEVGEAWVGELGPEIGREVPLLPALGCQP